MSIQTTPRTYSANFTASVDKSGAMTPTDWAELSRADENAGHREMKCTRSSMEPVPQSLHGRASCCGIWRRFQPVAIYQETDPGFGCIYTGSLCRLKDGELVSPASEWNTGQVGGSCSLQLGVRPGKEHSFGKPLRPSFFARSIVLLPLVGGHTLVLETADVG